jgi:hypothetical protein
MKRANNFITTIIVLILFGTFSMHAQEPRKVMKVKSTKVKTFDAYIVKLEKEDPKAAKQASKWKTATNFKLDKNGNFIPYYPTRNNDTDTKDDIAAGPVNCAKITCPGSFGENVVCWECH